MTVAHGSREISNSRGIECFNVCTRAYVCVYVSLSATTSREGPTLQDSLPVQKGRRLCLLPLFSFLSLPRASSFSLSMRMCKRACVAASAVFAIFYFAWKMVSRETVRAMRACPLNRMPYPPFPVCRRFLPCNRSPSRHTQHSSSPLPALPYVPRDSGRLPLAKTTCLSILPVALLRVIKVSPFSFPFLSPYIPLSLPPFFVPLFPHVASATIHLVV